MPKGTKQVIVIRTMYPHPTKKGELYKPRTGKLISQACHASMSFLTKRIQGNIFEDIDDIESSKYYSEISLKDVEIKWLDKSFTKICVYVESEKELLEIHEKAKSLGIESHLIVDNGRTEFKGVPTATCCAIGPDDHDKIDAVTGNLRLF